MLSDLHLSVFARSDVLSCPHEPASDFIRSYWEAFRPGPANFTVGAYETKLLIKNSGICKILKLRENADSVFGMDQFPARRWIGAKGCEAVAGKRRIRLVYVGNFLCVGIHHPKYFLNVASHLLEAFFALTERKLGVCSFGHITED